MIIDINNYLSWGDFRKQPHVANLPIAEQMKHYSLYSQQYNMMRMQWLAENVRLMGSNTTTTSAAASAGGAGGHGTPPPTPPPTPPTVNADFVTFGSRGSFDRLAGYADSTNLDAWYTASLGSGNGVLSLSNTRFATGSGIATDGDNWVAVGKGSGSANQVNSIMYSNNGKSWNVVDQSGINGTVDYRDVAWGYISSVGGSTTFVAVGSGSIANSTDGANWTYDNNSTFNGLYAVGNGLNSTNDNIWLAVGDNTNATRYGYTTSNATSSWTTQFDLGSSDPTRLRCVVFANDVSTWLIGSEPGVGNDCVYKSTDGTLSWTPSGNNLFTTACHALAYGGSSLWVAGGDGSDPIQYSTDNGDNWNSAGAGSLLDVCYSIAWNGTYFIAVGSKSGLDTVALYSTDGQTWTQSTNTTQAWADGYAVASATGPQMYPAR
jgi:hypothetical protein